MSLVGPAAGAWMLLALAVLVVGTGLPVWALLCGVASAFAALGVLDGQFDLNILSALPTRLVGLLEHDLLQALPLYVFIGVLLQRLSVADALFSSLARLFRRSGAGASLAALGLKELDVHAHNGRVHGAVKAGIELWHWDAVLDRTSARTIWQYLLPRVPFDEYRHDLLTQFNVQPQWKRLPVAKEAVNDLVRRFNEVIR